MKILELLANERHHERIRAIAKRHEVVEIWNGCMDETGRQSLRMLVSRDRLTPLFDELQGLLESDTTARMMLVPVEGVWPVTAYDEAAGDATASREELYSTISRQAEIGQNYIWLVILSTIVATVGLLTDNVAIIIGAMVIAPLLGPNIAFAFGTSIGNSAISIKAIRTLFVGLAIAFTMAVITGFFWPSGEYGPELLSRTEVGIGSIVLALASGVAAVLSITSGMSSVLVGVMVAVALLPPVATAGIMLAGQQYDLALSAGLLLLINISSVNLTAKLVFLLKGIRPRQWLDQQRAQQSMMVYLGFWLVLLLVLSSVVYLRWY